MTEMIFQGIGRSIFVIENYSYSPYLNALVNNPSSHKIDGKCDISDALNIIGEEQFMNYIQYIESGTIRSTNDLDKFIDCCAYMGHNFDDLSLIHSTISDKKYLYIREIMSEKIALDLGEIDRNDGIDVLKEMKMKDVKGKDWNYVSDKGEKVIIKDGLYYLYYREGSYVGDEPITLVDDDDMIFTTRTDYSHLRESGSVLVDTKEKKFYNIENGHLYLMRYRPDPYDHKYEIIDYEIDEMGSITVKLVNRHDRLTFYNIGHNIYVSEEGVPVIIDNGGRSQATLCDEYLHEALLVRPTSNMIYRRLKNSSNVNMEESKVLYKSYIEEYILVYLRDLWIRDNMIKLGLNSDPLYDCSRINNINQHNLNFIVNSVDNIFHGLDYIIAGGSILSVIHDVSGYYSDIDLFFCGDECDKVIERLKNTKMKHTITGNAITIHRDIPIQIILRRYSSPTEVIHGFDVDCSSIMYYRGAVYCTSRCELALKYRCNMFNTKRMSETYVNRLIKYRSRGFPVLFPDLRLVYSMRYSHAKKLITYVTDKLVDDNLTYVVGLMDKMHTRFRYKRILRDLGLDDGINNQLKLASIESNNTTKITTNNSGYILKLVDMRITCKRGKKDVSDYEKIPNGLDQYANRSLFDVIWKEQDPMTQVTSTFNPLEYDNFRSFLLGAEFY